MGADDELVEKASAAEVRAEIRKKYEIEEDDFLIINGGKIDLFKKQTLLLMDAVNSIDDPKVKLIVFGSIVPELKEEINNRLSDRVKYIGWVKSDDSYNYFAASDLAVFPGRHSVFWEQVAGQGIPMICKRWVGTDHVNVNGNVLFLETDTAEEIKDAIGNVMDHYGEFKAAADKSRSTFAYGDIAKRSIE
jgi:glycosyltransferase involved in cell wall biosynthesis